MAGDRLPFPRYIWCETCNRFETFTRRKAHSDALQGICPDCGGDDLVSRPPENHEKKLKKVLDAKSDS